eukprot:5812174-Ditylum_brightwellii.AAC.1
MFNQNGTFNCIDTCNAISYGRFGFNFILSSEAEARSLKNHPDIVTHLANIGSENIISQFLEKEKLEFAECFSATIDCNKYRMGATNVSLDNYMILQKEKDNPKILAWHMIAVKALIPSNSGSNNIGQNAFILVKT